MKYVSIKTNVNVDKLMEDLEKLTGKSDDMEGKNMTTTSFVNDCVKCIDMCKKEFSKEFAEWMEKIILEEVSGRFETKKEDTKIKSMIADIGNVIDDSNFGV